MARWGMPSQGMFRVWWQKSAAHCSSASHDSIFVSAGTGTAQALTRTPLASVVKAESIAGDMMSSDRSVDGDQALVAGVWVQPAGWPRLKPYWLDAKLVQFEVSMLTGRDAWSIVIVDR